MSNKEPKNYLLLKIIVLKVHRKLFLKETTKRNHMYTKQTQTKKNPTRVR